MTGGKALAGVAMVTEACWEAEGVEEMVSDIANFLSRVPSSCNTAQWPIMFVQVFFLISLAGAGLKIFTITTLHREVKPT